MSLVSTYVESQSGTWYCNPIVEEGDWFICWDDDEPIELVIKDSANLSAQTVLNRLHKQGWNLRVLYKGYHARRNFNDQFCIAQAYFLEQHNGPTDSILRGNRPLGAARPAGQGVFYFNKRNGHR